MKHFGSKSTRPASIEAQLEKILLSRRIAGWAHRLWLASDLPAALQYAIRDLARGAMWCAYSDDHQVYFVMGRMHPPAYAATEALMEVYFLDAAATLLARGFWRLDLVTGVEPQEVTKPCSLSTPLLPAIPVRPEIQSIAEPLVAG